MVNSALDSIKSTRNVMSVKDNLVHRNQEKFEQTYNLMTKYIAHLLHIVALVLMRSIQKYLYLCIVILLWRVMLVSVKIT